MNYLTYEEYSEYGGSLDETAFNRLAFKAQKFIDARTFGRLKKEVTVSESVKRLMFELVGLLGNSDYSSEVYSPTVSSEGNDGYSTSFVTGTVLTIELAEAKMKQLIDEYLSDEKDSEGTPLLCCWY